MMKAIVLMVFIACVTATLDMRWRRLSITNKDDTTVSLTVALKQQNLQKLNQLVFDVSDPRSENYGKHLSLDEVANLVAPTSEAISKVTEFWSKLGATQVELTKSRDFLKVVIPVSALEAYFSVPFYLFRHFASGREVIRTEESWNLRVKDADVEQCIDIITGLSDFVEYPTEKAAKFEFGGTNTSAPDLYGRVYGSNNEVTPNIYVYCKNGQPTQDPDEPCSDFPPKVASITLEVTPVGLAPIEEVSTADGFDCHSSQNKTVCWLTVRVPPYSRVGIRARVNYTDDSSSDWGYYPVKFAPTDFILPETIFKTYNVPLGTRAGQQNNSQAVTAFEKQYISMDDLNTFFDMTGLERDTPIIRGPNDEKFPGGESTLDIQYIMGIGAGVPTTFWSVGGDPRQGGYILEWALQVSNVSDAPLVTSISYGDTEQGFYKIFGGWSYIERMEVELQKMAARGLTVLGGSGDAGASNVGEEGNDISYTDPTCTPFRPFYPSCSAYVLSVGSTFLTTDVYPICNENVTNTPINCNEVGEAAVSVDQGSFWTTGGGFSNYSAAPSWQAQAIGSYLNSSVDLPPAQYYNQSGRGYPDISTLGQNLLMILDGQVTPVSGTSASGPVMAGLVSLWNEERFKHNLAPLGLISPLLYHYWEKYPDAFQDVVVGDNASGDIQARDSPYPTFCEYGFDCHAGWDPVTGLGTPNWGRLVEYDLSFGKSTAQF